VAPPFDSLVDTPEPPYTAVVFTSVPSDSQEGYTATAAAMAELAIGQPGYLGAESAHDSIGITVSYWRDEDAARAWKEVAAHVVAQHRGKQSWYADYRVRVATVTRDYGLADGKRSPGR
jgi:heme-degrading monooxygenase HmoA